MHAHSFREVFAVIHDLDKADLEQAGVIRENQVGGSDWSRFNRDFGTFVLRLPTDRLEKLVTLIETRLSKEN